MNKSSSVLVSVILPVFNVEKYLERCLDSILNQTYANFELIVVNDGSTDNSLAICEQFKKKDGRIDIVSQPNGGLSVARNTGLSRITGDFVIFVDSDDFLKPKMIESLLSFAIKNNLKLVECGIINSKDLRDKKTYDDYTHSNIETQSEAMQRLLETNNFSVWRRIYSKEIVVNRKFIPGKISEDVFFTIDSINLVNMQGFISEQLYVYNVENTSITRSPYSLKKMESKDALYYITEHTKNYEKNIRDLASHYLLKGLINHYTPLFTHSYLDKNYEHRKKIKKEIQILISKMYKNNIILSKEIPKLWLISNSPIWLYGLFVRLNQKRIDIQKLFK